MCIAHHFNGLLCVCCLKNNLCTFIEFDCVSLSFLYRWPRFCKRARFSNAICNFANYLLALYAAPNICNICARQRLLLLHEPGQTNFHISSVQTKSVFQLLRTFPRKILCMFKVLHNVCESIIKTILA